MDDLADLRPNITRDTRQAPDGGGQLAVRPARLVPGITETGFQCG
jgi:hypothetical protein